MTPESAVKKAIRAWLKEAHPTAYVYAPVPTGFGASSLDILVCLKGKFIGIEVKSAEGKMTPRQGVVINQIRAAGGIAFVARSVADVQLALAEPEILTTKAF